jgi:hypothetical protein
MEVRTTQCPHCCATIPDSNHTAQDVGEYLQKNKRRATVLEALSKVQLSHIATHPGISELKEDVAVTLNYSKDMVVQGKMGWITINVDGKASRLFRIVWWTIKGDGFVACLCSSPAQWMDEVKKCTGKEPDSTMAWTNVQVHHKGGSCTLYDLKVKYFDLLQKQNKPPTLPVRSKKQKLSL